MVDKTFDELLKIFVSFDTESPHSRIAIEPIPLIFTINIRLLW
jgi:hypothetical protein